MPTVPRETLDSTILILGAQRSGTTWLAKIVDSHPDVLYLHELEEVAPAPAQLTADGLLPLLRRWLDTATVRESGGRPFFAKSWQAPQGAALRTGAWFALKAAGRVPGLGRLGNARLPEFARRPPPRLAIKSIRWAEGAAVLADTLLASRTLFILRHPCGQVASVMRGNRQQRFDLRTEGTDMPFDEVAALAHAARHGVDGPAFQALSEAGRYAWSWRAFNEPAYDALAGRPNVDAVSYEALCADPTGQSRRIMAFAGLSWHPQTEAFVARSTSHQGEAGYYAIFRNAIAAAEGWRASMSAADQKAVRDVVAGSPLVGFWSELAAAGADMPG